jgi:hypothetical protein
LILFLSFFFHGSFHLHYWSTFDEWNSKFPLSKDSSREFPWPVRMRSCSAILKYQLRCLPKRYMYFNE